MEKIKENKKIIISLILIIVVIGIIGLTYAWLTTKVEGNKTNVIMAKSLKLEIKNETNAINIEKAEPLPDSEGLEQEEYEFTIENTGAVRSGYTIYLDDVELETTDERMEDKNINYTLNSNTEIHKLTETGTNPNRILKTGTIGKGQTRIYKLRIWIDKEADNSVTKKVFSAKIRLEATQATDNYDYTNENIKAVYTYNEENEATKCITGEETTCQTSTNANNVQMGTIIKYAVNNSEERYFYVLHDDGETMTLQQRENTIRNIAWYSNSSDNNTKGPLTILPELESATSNWTNVNNQTYIMGETNFNNTNKFTGCTYRNDTPTTAGTYKSCTTNKYTLPERTAKARMITAQEVMETGCKEWKTDNSQYGSCPDFMFNYLYQSTSYGGNVDDNSIVNNNYNFGYWTMSAGTSASSSDTHSWDVVHMGYVSIDETTDPYFGARAVIAINK